MLLIGGLSGGAGQGASPDLWPTGQGPFGEPRFSGSFPSHLMKYYLYVLSFLMSSNPLAPLGRFSGQSGWQFSARIKLSFRSTPLAGHPFLLSGGGGPLQGFLSDLWPSGQGPFGEPVPIVSSQAAKCSL